MEMRLGFIGLGVMGSPMARRILEKYGDLVVFDVEPAKMERFQASSAQLAQDVAQVGALADVILLSLPGSPEVKEVVLGQEGLISTMHKGGVVIDTSTTEPSVSIEVAEALAAQNLRFLDAPVSGGEQGAIDGTLSIMVGGEQAVFQEFVDLLQTIGTTVVRVGDAGMGEVAKMVNQMIVGTTFAVVAEGLALATKAGLNPEILYEAIRNGWAGSKVLDVAVPAVLKRDFKPGGTVNTHYKDLGYALSLAKDQDVPVPVTAMVHEIFKAARAGGKGRLSQPAIVTLWEDLLGIDAAG